jgi:prefoldin subunit 5
MKRLESSIERRVIKLAAQIGVLNIKVKQTGWPDRQFMIPGGKPLFIEFKRPGEVPRPLQLFIHDQLRKLGYQVEVHTDADEALKSITEKLNSLDASRVSKKRRKVSTRARRLDPPA